MVWATRRGFLALAGGAAAGLLATARPLRAGSVTSAAVGPVSLNVGVVVVRAQYNGSGHWTASLVQQQPGTGSTAAPAAGGPFNLFDRTGAFKGGAAAIVAIPGTYFVQVSADSPCQFNFEQPRPQTVIALPQTSFSGSGQDVSPYFTLPGGISSLRLQTTSPTLRGWLYHLDDSGGEAVQGGVGGSDGRFFDLTAPGAQTAYTVTLPDSGPYLLAVNNVDQSDAWGFSFSQ